MMPILSFTIPTPGGPRRIGKGEPCFIVAEMSANHCQDLDRAVSIVEAAARSGADAIKLQTYTPDSLTLNSQEPWFFIDNETNPKSWQHKTLYELYQAAVTPRSWHAQLQEQAERLGLVFFSTPFSPDDVDFLETLDVPLYKVASYECTDIPLLKKIGSTQKPVIMSVGFAIEEEMSVSLQTLYESGAPAVALLHCLTSYAESIDFRSANLATIEDMAERFHTVVGFSDNNAGSELPALAVAMGASIVEKHLVLEGDTRALDARFSLSPGAFCTMVERIRTVEKARGGVHYGPQTPAEEHNRRLRRSLFSVEDIKTGDFFSAQNVRSLRPAVGLEPRYYSEVIGKRAACDITRGTPLRWEFIA